MGFRSGTSGGGVTDHGNLSGLADDDHTQYQKESERGVADGYASLDSTGKVPSAQIPSTTTIVMKTTDETVNNSNTLQNDDELLAAVEANKRYFVEVFLQITAVSTTADFLAGFSVPAAATYRMGRAGIWGGSGATGTVTALSTTSQLTAADNMTFAIEYRAYVNIGATAGNLNFQWAQNTATAENTTVLTGSFMRLTKLN